MNIKKYLITLLLLMPLMSSASDVENINPKVMYDFMPYIGGPAPEWILNLNQQEKTADKVVKTIDYQELNSNLDYRYTIFNNILYSVEVRIGSYDKPRWSIEDQYEKLAIATGIADSLTANGFVMTTDKLNKKVRYFEKMNVFITLDNYQTQYIKDSKESAILLTFTAPKFTEQVSKNRSEILNKMSIEHKDVYKDLIGK
jgi:hypothetical protein